MPDELTPEQIKAMSAEQIEARLEQLGREASAPEDAAPAQPEATEPPAQEAAPTEPATGKEGPTPEEPKEDKAAEIAAALEEMRLQLQEESIRREKLESQLSHERRLRDDSATKAGYYKRVALDLAREPDRQPQEYEGEAPQVPEQFQRFARELEELKAESVARSTNDAMDMFRREYPDATEHMQDMIPFVKAEGERYAALMESNDPKIVKETALLILRSAYLETQANQIKQKRSEAQTRRAQQMAKITETKKTAAISGSTAQTAAPAKAKTTKEMDLDEIEAALRRVDWSR